jgi:hypothetical protein
VVASDKSNAIYTAFDRWLDTKNLSLIEKFTREELETALIECGPYKDMPPYLAMQSRVEKLKDIERRRAETISRKFSGWEKLKWAFIGAVVTIVAELIINVYWIRIKQWFE